MSEAHRIEYRVDLVQAEVYRQASYLVWTGKEQVCVYRPGLTFDEATALKATYEARWANHGKAES